MPVADSAPPATAGRLSAAELNDAKAVLRREGYGSRGEYNWKLEFPTGQWLDEDLPGMLAKLSPRQRTFVAGIVRGFARVQLRERLGVGTSTSQEWEQSPWWEPACDEERRKYFGDLTAHLLPHVPRAIERLKTEIEGGPEIPPELAHQSAIWLLEKIGGKPAQTQVNKRDPEEKSAVVEITELLRAAADLNGQLKAEQHASLAAPQPAPPPAVQVEVTELPRGDA